jgi:hypothetical protein
LYFLFYFYKFTANLIILFFIYNLVILSLNIDFNPHEILYTIIIYKMYYYSIMTDWIDDIHYPIEYVTTVTLDTIIYHIHKPEVRNVIGSSLVLPEVYKYIKEQNESIYAEANLDDLERDVDID